MRPDLVQSALIGYLKTKTEVTTLLTTDTNEIRENQWQGRDFSYPAIRFHNVSLKPDTRGNCNSFLAEITWMVFSEKPSSWEADKISGIISQVLHDKQFMYEGILIYLRTINISPADRKDERTWQSEVRMSGSVSQPT